MLTLLSVSQVLLTVLMVVLVLMNSGKDTGLSGAFGVGGADVNAGSSLVERNLTRYTIIAALLWAANIIALVKL